MTDSPSRAALRRAWRSLLALAVVVAGGACAGAAWGQASPPGRLAVAFHYGARPPLDELKAFDIAVVEPDHVADPRPHRREARDGAFELFAYVSFGEVDPTRPYFKRIPDGVLKGENRAWGSSVVDHTASAWRGFFIDQIVAPLWARGYRGFFLDTMDSYHLIARSPEARAAQETAMVATFEALKARFPGIRLITNRGFEILPRVREAVVAVAAESLFRGWDPAAKRYREVPPADREWLEGQLRRVRDELGMPVIAIDYVAPAERDLARTTARRIAEMGFTPWVSNAELDMLGVGSREVLPRRVLVLTERPEDSGDFHTATAQRFLGMPLNHLGYTYEMLDPRTDALPEGTLRGRYAGVVVWVASGGAALERKLAGFLERQLTDGVRVAVFNRFPFALEAERRKRWGLVGAAAPASGRLAIEVRDAMMGFEREPLPDRRELVPLRAGGDARSLLRVADAAGGRFDAAAITSWGGYALTPFVFATLEAREQSRWIVDPVAFLAAALARPDLPVPDVTTEAGRRMLITHIDGDGWASRAEMPGTPYASEVLVKEVLERYRVPTTVSVIQGEIAADGLYPRQSAALEAIARRAYLLPHVEPASHSFSHPFDWSRVDAPEVPGETSYHLAIPGYRFDLGREIAGSVAYIDRSLVPAGRRTAVFLWTGNCVPLPAALAASYAAGLLNMNGGDTLITRSYPSLTAVAAQGIRKGDWYQVFAPMQNENVYTNNWTGPFYGYERLIETIELTEKPRRFKPINIYYHVYAASKVASLNALHKVYRHALSRPVAPVFASDYIRKVLDFESMALATDLASGELLVRGSGALRTLRADAPAAVPDPARGAGVAGVSAPGTARYVTLAAAEARLAFGAPVGPYLADANGTVDELSRGPDGLQFSLESQVAPSFRLAAAERCGVTINGAAVRLVPSAPAEAGIPLQRHDTEPAGPGRAPYRQVVRVRCP